jgi:mono/diheme cytochrome c family protein
MRISASTRTRIALAAALAPAAALAAGCDLDLERMIEQPRYTADEACEVCPEGTIMMQPPAGTVSRTAELGPAELLTGRAGGAHVARIPIPLDAPLLARGQNRFDIFCAACHGRLGNGISQVAENMTLRRPPNLLAPPYADYPPGRVYAVIAEGYGLMRSYAPELPVRDRWAVVAYLEALELAQGIALDALPPSIQEEARRWLP